LPEAIAASSIVLTGIGIAAGSALASNSGAAARTGRKRTASE
jgi:hypothetical protein